MPERRAAAVHVAAKLGALDEGVSPLVAREDDDGGRQGKVRYHACGSLPGSRLFRWDVWGWADHCRWFLSSADVGPILHSRRYFSPGLALRRLREAGLGAQPRGRLQVHPRRGAARALWLCAAAAAAAAAPAAAAAAAAAAAPQSAAT